MTHVTFYSFLRLTHLNVRIKNIDALLDTSKDASLTHARENCDSHPESGPETAPNILVRFVVIEEYFKQLIYSNYEESTIRRKLKIHNSRFQ